MPRVPGTTDAQSQFLRAFRKSPYGPPADQWPSPAILRRWLRRDRFIRAMNSMVQSLQYQSDFLLLISAAQASRMLSDALQSTDTTEQTRQVTLVQSLLKLAHSRQRHAKLELSISDNNGTLLTALQRLHPQLPVGEALEYLFRPREKEQVA